MNNELSRAARYLTIGRNTSYHPFSDIRKVLDLKYNVIVQLHVFARLAHLINDHAITVLFDSDQKGSPTLK